MGFRHDSHDIFTRERHDDHTTTHDSTRKPWDSYTKPVRFRRGNQKHLMRKPSDSDTKAVRFPRASQKTRTRKPYDNLRDGQKLPARNPYDAYAKSIMLPVCGCVQ